MNNFGVIELATTKTTNAPGWAYVPDTAPNIAAPASSLQSGNRKRAARNQATASTSALYADADARQEAKLRREIEALDRDNYHRDVNIPVVSKSSNKNVKKHTPNVRKILQSQKTFANHLDDFEAFQTSDKATSNTYTHATQSNTDTSTRASAGGSKKGAAAAAAAQKEREKEQQKSKKSSKSTSRSASISKATPAVKQEEDVEMADALPHTDPEAPSFSPHSTILTPYSRPGYPPSHPLDNDPLLVSRVPPLPTDAELKELLRAPPLSYAEARGRWTEDDKRYPPRVFCEVCGYWGRVRCMKCGVRVCALECLETHREECITRYGL
ncbi:hypothetical protein K449DRAFT_418825 [Hypoxylon sp. EC38]|nr:hypothetical protein K449DRAFT_418825 [Hypoxylon sp. EC38]